MELAKECPKDDGVLSLLCPLRATVLTGFELTEIVFDLLGDH